MRRICVPPALMPIHLAEFQEIPAPLRTLLALDAPYAPHTLRYDEALTLAETALNTLRRQHERHSEALVNLYMADLLWRAERWLEALELVSAAASWLKVQPSPIARYNEAIAVYFTALLHFCLHADGRALPQFIEAQSQLDASRRYWAVHAGREYFETCTQVSQWIAALVPLRAHTPPGSHTLIIPVYPYPENGVAPDKIEAVALPLELLRVPSRVLDYLGTSTWLPLETEALPLLDVRPGAYFFGVRLSADEQLTPYSREGDLVVMEALSPLMLPDASGWPHDAQPFVRRPDGTVVLRDPQRLGQGFVGIPRVLLRQAQS